MTRWQFAATLVVGLCAVSLGLLLEARVAPLLAVALVLALATLLGLFHGVLVTKVGLQPFIVTLCGLFIYRGLAQWVTLVNWRNLIDRVTSFGASTTPILTGASSRTVGIGGPHPDYGVLTDKDAEGHRAYYWGDPWHFALSRMMVACRAYGLRPIDGPFGDFSDPDGYLAAAKRAAVLGFEGKWAIHPSQVELANKVFTPSEAEVTKAKRIVEAMQQAAKEGKGAVSLDGRLIDIASIRQAEALINKAKQCGMA